MSIIQYTATKARKVRGTNVARGSILYAVKKGPLYFIWSYVNKDAAEKIDAKLVSPSDATDIAANWRLSIMDLVPSAITADKI